MVVTVFLANLTAQGAPPKVTKNKSPGDAWEVSLLLIKDKSVHNKRRERVSCQAKKLGGFFFLSYFVCTISCKFGKKLFPSTPLLCHLIKPTE